MPFSEGSRPYTCRLCLSRFKGHLLHPPTSSATWSSPRPERAAAAHSRSPSCHVRRATDKQPSTADDLATQHTEAKQQQAAPRSLHLQARNSQQPQQQQQQVQHRSLQGQDANKQSLQQGLYHVPWDIWEFIQVTAAVLVINMAIPFAVLSSAAHLQSLELSSLPVGEKELLNFCCQLLQLGCTFTIINASISKHQPLPKPWYLFELGTIPVFQALATSIAAVGSGVLLAGFMSGHVDGAEEWRHLAGLHQDDVGTLALVLGALVLAPATEEYFFRGYVLPSLTKWIHPGIAVPLTGLLFASIHPADSFWPEALLGSILSLSLLAADGNLLVPLLAHSLYNTFVLGTEFLL